MKELPILTKLKAEYDVVERELRVEVPKELATAAAHGDLRENAEYEAAKHRQSFLQARGAHLQNRIAMLSGLDLDAIPRDKIGFGSKVVLEDLDEGGTIEYEIVTPEEVNPKEGKISLSSPIGKSLHNKKEGDEVEAKLPSGDRYFEVKKLTTLHDVLLEG